MTRRRIHMVYLRVACAMIPIIIAITILPSVGVTNQVGILLEAELETQLVQALNKLSPYLESGEYSADALVDLFSDTLYQVTLYPGKDAMPLTDNQRAGVNKNAVTVVNEDQRDGYIQGVVWCGNQYAVVTVDLTGLLGKISKASTGIRAVYLGIGIVFILIASRQAVKPVITLDNAAKKVADGDFTVQIPTSRRRDEIGSLIDSFNAMVQELGKTEMFRTSFVSDVSHEFKIPLTTISGYAKLLQAECSPEEQEEYTDIIIEETTHLSTLVDNILTLNRLEKHAVPARPEAVNLAEQIRRALTLYEQIWTEKGIDFTFELDEVTIQGYGTLLMQVWTNLIDNAIKFSRRGGRVSLSLTQHGHAVQFVITDEGSGIEADKQKQIFDKFYKTDNSRNTEGNGLGLAIARRIVEIHDGEIAVDSTTGVGTTFTIRLQPVARDGE